MSMILVTGATGFLGHNLAPRLLDAGYRVRALARPDSEATFLEQLGVEIVRVTDITDAAGVRRACAGCHAVIHAAGHFRMWGPLHQFWQTNVEGTATVLEAAQRAGVSRFLHISTVVVVGKTIPGRPVDETHPCIPQDFYQRTKLEGERLALAYHRYRDLPVIVLRPGALYGPWGRYAFNRLFFEDPLRGWRIRVEGGRRITFPAFTPDVAEGIVSALSRGRAGEIYHLSGETLSHNAVNGIVSQLAGIGRWRLDVPTPAVLLLARAWTALSRFTGREPFYPINLAHYVFQDWPVSSEKAREALCFRPTPFVEGARATLAWYRRQGVI
ncbi:MAG: NAD-dependent epimerase/dehydratase family protein [Candidatus Promineifilaceae bacterium]|nr:NAD-dependent epimerase/dehydratase family protein [Candidatus Promineifilaceae bacterium]